MKRLVSALGPATKGLALGSLVLAIGYESWLARPVWRLLPLTVAGVALAGLIGGRFARWPTTAAVLFFTYISPALALLLLGRFTVEFLVVWSAALTGVMAADRDRWQWAFPSTWRFALILWAVTVAVAWPITALREADFESLALLQRYNIPNTGIGGSPRTVIIWGMDTAIIHLLGLLWFNWLFQHAGRLADGAFQRRIAWPMAASIIVGSLLALYQGVFDRSLLTVGAWASLQRAPGSLLDANAFGAAAAMWTAALLAFISRSWLQRGAALTGAAVCWGGLWMSGSRTALIAACTPLISVSVAALKQPRGARVRLHKLAAGAAGIALLALVLVLVLAPAAPGSPLGRLRSTLPSDFSSASLGAFVREMWNRNGYGEAATGLIAEHPVTGVGIGLFNLSGAAYSRSPAGHLPPDNAQNWWRHHIAELGFLGAAGLLFWTFLFLVFLARTSGDGPRRLPAAALKGALVGFGLVSLVGMPAQSLPVTITFWTVAFWYARLAAPTSQPVPMEDVRPARWAVLLALVAVYGLTTLVLARGDNRPAMRAAAGKWRYTLRYLRPRHSGCRGTNASLDRTPRGGGGPKRRAVDDPDGQRVASGPARTPGAGARRSQWAHDHRRPSSYGCPE